MRKKLAIWLAGLAMVALPASAMALTAVSDSDLAGVTGQAGVSMSIDVTAEVAINTLAWGDSDGWAQAAVNGTGALTGPDAGGFVGISGLNATFHMSPVHRWTAGMNAAGASATVGTEVALSNKRALTIDVAGNYAWSALPGQEINLGFGSLDYGAVAGAGYTAPAVRIGLPSSHFTISALDMKVFLSGIAAGAPDAATKRVLGNMYIDGFAMELGIFDAATNKLEAGEILIGPTPNAGVSNALGQSRGVRIIVAPKIASIAMNAISWGNDGLYGIPYGLAATGVASAPFAVPSAAQTTASTASTANLSAAGYVGLRNMAIAGVEVYGDITISVGTAKLGTLLAKGGDVRDTPMVQISIADGSYFRMASFSAEVAVSDSKNLVNVSTAQAAVMGTFYMDGVSVTMRRSPHMNIDGAQGAAMPGIDSYFRIYAH